MSAFEYYSKNGLPSDPKRKTTKNHKVRKTKLKKLKTKDNDTFENKSNNIQKGCIDLKNIYNINLKNSTKTGKKLLEWFIHPLSVDNFMSDYWEKEILHVPRNSSNYFSQLFSLTELDTILRENNLQYGTNIDITSYIDNVRETHNPVGRAHPHVVWDYFNNKCSVRLLNPQLFAPEIYKLMTNLQEYFGSLVGCNVYLTPPFSQGFAPHYDDIEAFVVQINGEKHWRVYKPRSEFEILPRTSSRNFHQDEIGNPILDVILRPGDFLYMPRGYIHQADTLFTEMHSLHLTFSTYQQNSMYDFLQVVINNALNNAAKNDKSYRSGLPIGYQYFGGLCELEKPLPPSVQRKKFENQVSQLINNLKNHMDLDHAIDMFSVKNFYTNSLPPSFSNIELLRTVANGSKMQPNGKTTDGIDLENAEIKLIRRNCFRLVEESMFDEETNQMANEFRLYYNLDNSKQLHGNECQFLIIPDEMGLFVKKLFNIYPSFIKVSDLCDDNEQVMQLVIDLWERGLLIASKDVTSI